MSVAASLTLFVLAATGVTFLPIMVWDLRMRRRRAIRTRAFWAEQHRLNNAAMDADEAIERDLEERGLL